MIGRKQGHVGKWLHRDKKVPAELCIAIETAVRGAVTRYELRPDVFGAAPPPASSEPLRAAQRIVAGLAVPGDAELVARVLLAVSRELSQGADAS